MGRAMMAYGALFNPQRAGGARIMPEAGAALAVTNPTLSEKPELRNWELHLAARRDFAAGAYRLWLEGWSRE